ncbi:polysaccharide deacetylase family protein [Amylibacter sp.]|nr:polysaccharide deacetylase family protein [Amylibacter sp.]
MSKLTIVMYHYVRPIKESQFPGIKGLELDGFKRQLDHLKDKFNIVSTDQVVDAAHNGSPLPNDACWLTFDDGYKDHSNFVLPELLKRNLHAAFFPPRVAIEEDVVLDVNLIHHILSCADDVKNLVLSLNHHCLHNGISESEIIAYYNKYAVADRFDNAETIYVKRMLQHVLPEQLRTSIAEEMFKDFVKTAAEDFSQELYMSVEDVRGLVNSGMYVGSHGSKHYWLDKISLEEQEKDIKQSVDFLESVGAPTKDWVMCYPYGAYNDITVSLLEKYNASIGLTTEVRIADLESDSSFELPRLDTNDFPQ